MSSGTRQAISGFVLFSLLITGSYATDCNTDAVRAGFTGGGWTAAYGKRQWDGQSAVTAAAAVASVLGGPATASAAAAFILDMVKEHFEAAARALNEIGDEVATEAFERLATTLISFGAASKSLSTLDIKAAIIRVSCENCMRLPCPTWSKPGRTCPRCVASEGYYQIAVAYRPR